MIGEHGNWDFSGGLPLNDGDLYYSPDKIRDFLFGLDQTGRIMKSLVSRCPCVLYGLSVSKGTGDTLNITAGSGIVFCSVTVPDSYSTFPPSTKSVNMIRLVEVTAQTNLAIASATLDGTTINYVKVRYNETNGKSRSRAYASGSYYYERVPSFSITVSSVAPDPNYDLVIATFIATTGSFSFDINKRQSPLVYAEIYGSIKCNYASAIQVGSSLSIASMGNSVGICRLSSTTIAFFDEFNDELRCYRFNGSIFSLVGSGFSISGGVVSGMCALNGTDIAFLDPAANTLKCYRFDGSTWSLVGSALTISDANQPSISYLNRTDIAYVDDTIIRCYRFNGSTWSLVGSALTIVDTGIMGSCSLNNTDIALIGGTTELLKCYRFNGSTWSLVGSGLSIPSISNPSLTAINKTDVVLADDTSGTLRCYRFDGSTWSDVGVITAITLLYPHICSLHGTDIVLANPSSDTVSVYRFGYRSNGEPHQP